MYNVRLIIIIIYYYYFFPWQPFMLKLSYERAYVLLLQLAAACKTCVCLKSTNGGHAEQSEPFVGLSYRI